MHGSRPIHEIWLWESVLPKSNTVSNSGQTSGKGKANKRFLVAWVSFAFPLLIFILGLAFNYIIVLLKSYDASYKKGTVKEIRVWKKRGCSVKVLLTCVQNPPSLRILRRGGGICTYRNQYARDSGIVWPQKKTVLQHSEKYLVCVSRYLLRTILSSLM